MASIVLGAFWAWYAYDGALTSRLAKKYKPLPLPENPTYSSSDVSIIVPTIDTPDTFTDCLRLWLANHPREIIIVTIDRDLKRVHDLVQPVITEGDDRISLMTADRANKREQLITGIKEAKGKILALVDDDAFWGTVHVLPHLLAGFEDPKVGAAVGKQSAHIPTDRRNPKVITPWEVASLRSLNNQNDVQAVRKKHPYMARKMVERLLRPVLAWVHIAAFVQGFRNNSPIAYFAAVWYAWGMLRTYRGFVRRFPWTAGNIWAAVLLDNCYPILDVYAWLTLSTEAWGTRNASA